MRPIDFRSDLLGRAAARVDDHGGLRPRLCIDVPHLLREVYGTERGNLLVLLLYDYRGRQRNVLQLLLQDRTLLRVAGRS
jgi:hypothetical protein